MKSPIRLLAGLLLAASSQAVHGFDPATVDDRIATTGGELLIEYRGDFTDPQKQVLRAWLTQVGETVVLLHGELPRPQIRLALQPYPARSPVPFARVLRNEPQGVLFYINPDFPLQDYVSDWTAYHELSHLFIPYPGMPDIWFSEGLASYYQNILQYRAGLLDREATLEKLRAGFQRGRDDDQHADMTLTELSAEMRERRAFMRVYWSGALYFLEADIRLRRQTDNRLTLDDVLRDFGACCLMDTRDWNGLQMAQEFDRLAGADLKAAVFEPLYRRYSQSRAIPDYADWLMAAEMDSILGPDWQAANLPVE